MGSKTISVVKRDGQAEELNLEKIHRVLMWACEGIKGVSVSEIELRSQLKFFDGIKTNDIHSTLIRTTAELISEETPNYQYVASRLVNFNLRKEVYGQFEPWHIYKLVERNVAMGYYTPELLEWYSKEEWEKINKFIRHDRDYTIVYAGMGQWLGKYLVQNRVTKTYFETPQIAYILIAAVLMSGYDKSVRLKYIKDYYDALSLYDISVPTPILGGARTPTKQFSSCVLIDCGDSLDSINATASSIVNYVAKKAGIGLNVGRIRALGSEIRNGEVKHTGLIPFMKYFQAALKSSSQGGIRGGSATVYYPFWHHEVENLVVLKNNKGVEDNRIRHMDYGLQACRLFYKRALNNQSVTLFSPHEVPDLLDAFYQGNNDLFEKLYEKYEKSNKIKMKKVVGAYELMELFLEERFNTGRIYLQNIDHCNTHGSFIETIHPVTMSNLCVEITLPTKPLISLTDENGRIALCTLSAINWGNIKKPEDFEKPCELAVRSLDALLEYQDYAALQAKLSTEEFRTLGVGVVNLAYFLAKNNLKYDEAALPLIDEYMEAMYYYLVKASVQLAKEKGPCKLWKETKYGLGLFSFETRKPEIDELVEMKTRLDWETLRADLREYGIRNATLMALMPAESSSQLSNSTNGIEPPRGFVSEKASKEGVLKQVVPEYQNLKNKYDLLWDQTSPEGYLKISCVMQKYVDQAISTNVSYNPKFFDDGKIPVKTLFKHVLMYYRFGGKNLYYSNVNDGAGDASDSEIKQGKTQVDNQDDDCESCKI